MVQQSYRSFQKKNVLINILLWDGLFKSSAGTDSTVQNYFRRGLNCSNVPYEQGGLVRIPLREDGFGGIPLGASFTLNSLKNGWDLSALLWEQVELVKIPVGIFLLLSCYSKTFRIYYWRTEELCSLVWEMGLWLCSIWIIFLPKVHYHIH